MHLTRGHDGPTEPERRMPYPDNPYPPGERSRLDRLEGRVDDHERRLSSGEAMMARFDERTESIREDVSGMRRDIHDGIHNVQRRLSSYQRWAVGLVGTLILLLLTVIVDLGVRF